MAKIHTAAIRAARIIAAEGPPDPTIQATTWMARVITTEYERLYWEAAMGSADAIAVISAMAVSPFSTLKDGPGTRRG